MTTFVLIHSGLDPLVWLSDLLLRPLVEAEKASSDSGSDISSTATTDEDGDSLLGYVGSRANADDYDSYEYVLDMSTVDAMIRLSQ